MSQYKDTYGYKATRDEVEKAIKDLNWTVEEKGNSLGFSMRGLGAWRSASQPSSPSQVVYAKVGVNLWSWGERITVNLVNKTIKSEAAVLADFGKNKENVKKLKSLIDTDSAAGKKAAKKLAERQLKAAKALAKRQLKSRISSLIGNLSKGNMKIIMEASSSLVEIGEPAVPSLIRILGTPKYETSMAAGHALWKIGKPAVPPLINALSNSKVVVRRQSATALGLIGDNKAVKPLVKVLENDVDEGVRRDAATSLALLGHELEDNRVKYAAGKSLEDIESIRKNTGITSFNPNFGQSESELLRRAYKQTNQTVKLREAKNLFDEDLIDEEEYKQMKKNILGK